MRPVPSREHTSSAIPLRSERGIVMLTLEWNWLIMKAVQRWACCYAHAREWMGWIGWRRAARVGTARVRSKTSYNCRHIPLAVQHLSARAQNPNVDFSYLRAVTPPRCHVGASCERITLDRWDANRGSLSVWGSNVKRDRRVYRERIVLEKNQSK